MPLSAESPDHTHLLWFRGRLFVSLLLRQGPLLAWGFLITQGWLTSKPGLRDPPVCTSRELGLHMCAISAWLFLFFHGFGGLNTGLRAFPAGTLSTEPSAQPRSYVFYEAHFTKHLCNTRATYPGPRRFHTLGSPQ